MKKEHPILFNTEMIQAILDGRKNQTHRVIKPQPKLHKKGYYTRNGGVFFIDHPEYHCPYGKAGDELWVRETCLLWRNLDGDKELGCDGPVFKTDEEYEACKKDIKKIGTKNSNWAVTPSIYMPRWASRIQLVIKDIRIERLQTITNKDAIAEGIQVDDSEHVVRQDDDINWGSAKGGFSELWDSINADRGYGWDTNPFIWVVEFDVEEIKL
jgi:hypothetical protein